MLLLMSMQRPCRCQQWANYASLATMMVAKHNSWHLPFELELLPPRIRQGMASQLRFTRWIGTIQ